MRGQAAVWSVDMEAPKRQSTGRFIIVAIAVFLIWYFFIQPGSQELDASEQTALLRLARDQLVAVADGRGTIEVDEEPLPGRLLRPGSAFVTLSIDGELRGCMIDSFEAHEPLYRNVLRNTALAASEDDRFARLTPAEVETTRIAISLLTPPEELEFTDPDGLVAALEPGLDGVILTADGVTSSYLPDVWGTFPDPVEFLERLSEKAGLSPDRWREAPYPTIETFRAFRFEEA
jgi:AmmeMemoRadiSam system protein A